MNSIIDVIKKLTDAGIYVFVENGKLKTRSNTGAMTPEIIHLIKGHKQELLDYLLNQEAVVSSPTQKIDSLGLSSAPLSFSQQRLWVLDQIDGSSAHYNMPAALRLSGQLNVDALEKALTTIVERHESLRTCFETKENGEGIQVVQPIDAFHVNHIDLTTLSTADADAQMQAIVEEEASKPFDLKTDVMLRAVLVALSDQEHILVVTMHHIASDGWSLSILINEFKTLYQAYQSEQENPLAPLSIQYSDYACWQREWLQGDQFEKQMDYWIKQLDDLPPVHSLPLDNPRPTHQTFNGRTLTTEVNLSITERLNALCQSTGATLFMGLHAVFSTLLARYSNEKDIVMGTPIANREQSEVAGLIGFFVNNLVLRSDLTGSPSFRNLLQQSKQMILDAYAHQQVPFEQIVERLQPERSLAHSALFQVTLVLQNNESGSIELPELSISPVEHDSAVAKYDLTLMVKEHDQGLMLDWEYNTDLFQKTTIAAMADRFTRLLTSLVEQPDDNVFACALLNEKDEQTQLVEWNATTEDFPSDLCAHELFEQRVQEDPNAIAAVLDDEQLTYQALNERANQLAHYLVNTKQIQPDTLIGLCLPRSMDMLVGILGIMKAGGAYVPLDPEYPEARLQHMLDDASLATVITTTEILHNTPITEEQGICLDDEAIVESLSLCSTENVITTSLGLTSEHLSYAIYTSGSTGLPKASLLTHRGLCNLALGQIKGFFVERESRVLQFATIAFDAATSEVFMALVKGASLVLLTNEAVKSPTLLSETVKKYGVTHATIPPVLLPMLDRDQWKSVNTLIVAGDTCALNVAEAWTEGRRFINAYGPSETTVCATLGYFSQGQSQLHIGQPIQNVQTYVLNEASKPVPVGTPGELYIGGVGLSRGYLNRPELNAEKFVANPFYNAADPASSEKLYRTGDLVCWLPDGNLAFLGRVDQQVKIRGFRIETGEIEKVISRHECVKDAIVLVKTEKQNEKSLVAYVVPKGNANVEENEIVESLYKYVAAALPEYMVPSAFVCLDAMPLTPNGKVDRKALNRLEINAAVSQSNYVAPRTSTEKVICQVWGSLLSLEQVGINDNFFQLGGHSLLVMQMMASLKHHDLHMEASAAFQYPTPYALAEYLENKQTKSQKTYQAPENRIPENCQQLTPDMLPLVELSQKDIDTIVKYVPNGVENIQDIYPLAPMQEGIFFHHVMHTESDPYVTPILFKAASRDVVTKVIDALQFIINRHDVLRTQVLWKELASPVQVVSRQQALPVEWFQGDENVSFQAQIDALIAPENQWMNLEEGPLLNLTALSDPFSEAYYVRLQIHHIVTDHVGLEIIFSELDLLQQGQEDLLPMPVPYREFVAHALDQAKNSDAENYFSNLLSDVDEMTAPFGLSDTQGNGQQVDSVQQTLPEQLSKRIREVSQTLQLSPAAVFHAAWAWVIGACCNRNDVVFGSVVSGRLQGLLGAESMMGVFINTLPVRAKLEDCTALTLVKQLQESLYSLIPYEQTPLSLAQSCSALPAGATLFSAMMNYRHSGVQEESKEGQRIAPAGSDSEIELLSANERSNYPFDISVDDLGEGFQLDIHSKAPVSPVRVYQYMANALECIVNDIAQSSTTPVLKQCLLPEYERQHELSHWNTQTIDIPEYLCIHELIEKVADNSPEAIAVVHGQQEMTYSTLNGKANLVARQLIEEHGVAAGDCIGISTHRNFDMAIGILAILKAGGTYVPLDPKYPRERLQHIVKDTDLSLLLTQTDLSNHYSEFNVQALCLDAIEFNGENALENLHVNTVGVAPKESAYIIYTSGSTGLPKGVIVEHRNLVNFVHTANEVYQIKAGDRVMQFSTVNFDAFVEEYFISLTQGATLVLRDESVLDAGSQFWSFIYNNDINVVSLPSTFWNSIQLDFPEEKECCLKTCIIGGDVFNTHQTNLWNEKLGVNVINTYGPTETTVIATACEITEGMNTQVIGKPISNTQCYVLSEQRQPLPIGVVGELYIGGQGVARGYLNNAELTNSRFIENNFGRGKLYKTGDLVRWMPDGRLEFIGRADNQVKIRGFRIELGELESALCANDDVLDALVIAQENQQGENQLIAYVKIPISLFDFSNTEHEAEEFIRQYSAMLRDRLSTQLPDYMVPAHYVLLNEFPLTANGKVDRNKLPQSYVASGQSHYVAPSTLTEKTLAAIWEEILDVEKVGVQDNFFHLGGHSLSATRLVSKINQVFHVDFPLVDMFNGKDLHRIAEIIDKLEKNTHQPAIEKTDRDTDLPLSYSQQRLWILDQMEGGSAQYNMPGALKLLGDLDYDVLNRAIESIVQRHESLRTVFAVGENGAPVQKVVNDFSLTVPVFDYSHLIEEEKQQAITNSLSEDVTTPFDLSRDLMLRAKLIKVAEQEHILLFTMHHIASDGWSMSIVTREFSSLYAAYSEGKASSLSPLSIQYADYANWQRNWLQGEVLEKQLNYWVDQLTGLPVVHNLPLDNPRPQKQTYVGAIHTDKVDVETSEHLMALCQAKDATLFMGLHAAFSAILSRYSHETDIVMGTPIANREQAEVEDLIGFFVNTLILRSDLSSNPSFEALLEQSQKTLMDAYGRQQVPFENIVDRLQPERTTSHSPLFQIMLVLQNNEGGKLELSGLTLEPVETDEVISKYDITLNISESEAGLLLAWEYNRDLFEKETIAQLSKHFVRFLNTVVRAPETRVQNVELVDDQEKNQLIYDFNRTEREYPKSLCMHELFEVQAVKTPDSIAVICGERKITFSELNDQSNRLAHYLITQRSVVPGQLVGVSVERSIDMLVAMLATLKAGGAYVPVDPDYPESRIAYMLSDANVSTVITQQHLAESLPISQEQAVCLDDEQTMNGIALQSVENIPKDDLGLSTSDLAYAIYTSGSTGNPKGVMVTQENLTNFLWSMKEQPGMNERDCLLAVTSTSFDIHGLELFLPLVTGARLIIATKPQTADPLALSHIIDANAVSVMQATPATWKMLVNIEWNVAHKIKLLCGGEALTSTLASDLLANEHVELWNMYGPTETTIWSCVKQVLNGKEKILIGKPINNTSVYVASGDELVLSPVGVAGELLIAGDGVTQGYRNRDDLTEKAFIDNVFSSKADKTNHNTLYRTGDLVRWLPDGNLEYLSRIDNQVKVHGFRIELGEIETALARHAFVDDVVVIAKKSNSGDHRLVAYIENHQAECLNSDQPESVEARHQKIDDIKNAIRAELPHYMLPSAFVLLEKLPLTPNGKINRKALPEPDFSQQQKQYVAPETDMEKHLCAIWESILDIDKVGTHDNFFELGGSSLLVIMCINQVSLLGYELSPADVMNYPTVAALAPIVAEKKIVLIAENDLEQYNLAGEHQLLGAQRWFFDHNHVGNDFWLSVNGYEMHQDVQREDLERAISVMLNYHDGLRTVFDEFNFSKALIRKQIAEDMINFIQVSDAQDNELVKTIQGMRNEMIHIVGSTCRFLIVQEHNSSRLKLFTFFHHLVTDDASNRIFMSGFTDVLRKIREGKDVSLPAKGSSVLDAVDAEYNYLQSPESTITEEVEQYWNQLKWDEAKPFPVDFNDGVNDIESSVNLPFSFSEEESTFITTSVTDDRDLSIQTVLAWAMMKTICEWTEGKAMQFSLMEAGRDRMVSPEQEEEKIDLSHTMGWLASSGRFFLGNRVDAMGEIEQELADVFEQMNAAPGRGRGFDGYLLSDRPCSMRDPLKAMVRDDIEINYFGVVANSEGKSGEGLMSGMPLPEIPVEESHFDMRRHRIFVLYAGIINNKLEVNFSYSKNLYSEETIEYIGRTFFGYIKQLIEYNKSGLLTDAA